jgi:hypothetical protein
VNARSSLSRRGFLVAGSSAAVLAACGGGSSSSGTTKDPTDVPSTGSFEIGNRFASGTIVTGVAQRLPLVLRNKDGSAVSKGPDSFTAQLSLAGKAIGSPVTVARRGKELPAPYWLLQATFPEAGTWTMTATFPGGGTVVHPFSVIGKELNKVPTIGDKMVPVDTPTVADAQGVSPVCTRTPACPLHDTTLTKALTSGTPVALLIGTPAYCQTGICGPVLELLLAQQAAFGKIKMLHAEVYTKPYTSDPAPPPTKAVDAYQLQFEPYLVVSNASGVITARLDSIWDTDELTAALATATV